MHEHKLYAIVINVFNYNVQVMIIGEPEQWGRMGDHPKIGQCIVDY